MNWSFLVEVTSWRTVSVSERFVWMMFLALLQPSLSFSLGLFQQSCICLSPSLISKFSNSWVTQRHNVYVERRRQRHAGCGEGWCQNSCLFILYNETSSFFQRLKDWAQKSQRSKQTLGRKGRSLIKLHSPTSYIAICGSSRGFSEKKMKEQMYWCDDNFFFKSLKELKKKWPTQGLSPGGRKKNW